MQQHDSVGQPLCGACAQPVRLGELYVVVYRREQVDADPSVMMHAYHVRSMYDEDLGDGDVMGHSISTLLS